MPTPNLGAAYEDVAFTTSDGLRLEGWFVPSRNGATVIAFPGRSGPQKHTRMLVRHGYGVLLFDRRGEGASEGDPNIFGWHGERDLHAAAAYLRSRSDVDPERIGGDRPLGRWRDADPTLRRTRTRSKAIVSEGASGQSVRDGIANGELVAEILPDASITLATALFTNDLPPPSLKSEVPKIAPHAVFFVYGEKGQGGSRDEAEPRLLRGRSRAEADLGGPERPTHRRDHHGAGGVRAARDRLLRQVPAGEVVTEADASAPLRRGGRSDNSKGDRDE